MKTLTPDTLNVLIEASGADWQAAETWMSQLQDEEFAFYLGLDDRAPQEMDFGRRSTLSELDSEPLRHDLRNVSGRNFVTPVKNQSRCGSCVAFGCVAVMETAALLNGADEGPNVDLSEAHLFYCHGRYEGRTCETGWTPSRAFRYCVTPGIVTGICYPYDLTHQQCDNVCPDWRDRLWTIDGVQGLYGVRDMERWIVRRGALTACMDVYADFRHYKSGIYEHVSGERVGGHCVALVGYDGQNRCWIAKNSWGDQWGESGFFRIRYGSCRIDSWAVHGVTGIAAPRQ